MLKKQIILLFLSILVFEFQIFTEIQETLPKLSQTPQSLDEVWGGYDPEKEPMLVETHKEWEEEGVVIRAMRYYIGTFKGEKAWMAGLYAFPKGKKNCPAVLQSHGGGGSASSKACVNFGKRGYAIFSLSWRVEPRYLKNYDLPPEAQTYWGGVTGDQISDARGIESNNPRKLDPFTSGRNEGYFLRTLAARRGITFLAQQPEVNPDAIGMIGHSMGGVITHQTSAMEPIRIKTCAPSDGPPISHLHADPRNKNMSEERKKIQDLVNRTASPASYTSKIKIPMLFLNSVNDFHGHCEDVEWIIDEMPQKDYSIARTVHANHSHNVSVRASTYLWFDAHLKGNFNYPKRPEIEVDFKSEMTATLTPDPKTNLEIASVDFYYTRDGENDYYGGYQSRIWKFAKGEKQDLAYKAVIPVKDYNAPLWVYADVQYKLPESDEFYNFPDETKMMSSSSRMLMFKYEDLKRSEISMAPFQVNTLITDFDYDWQKEWMARGSNQYTSFKMLDAELLIPDLSKLLFEVDSEVDNHLSFNIGDFHAKYKIKVGHNKIEMYPYDFKNSKTKENFLNWKQIMGKRPAISFRSQKAMTPKQLRFIELTQSEFNQKRPFRLVKKQAENGSIDLNLALADEVVRKHGDFHKNSIPVFTAIKGKKRPDYDNGMLMKSGSEISYNLNKAFKNFEALCGVHHSGSVTYEVWADGDKLFDSGKITSKSTAAKVAVDVSDKNNLRLVVTDAGNGYHGDAGMWVNPVLK